MSLPLIPARRPLDVVEPILLRAFEEQGHRNDGARNLVIGANSAIEKVLAKIIESRRPELIARAIFASSSDATPGIESISWREQDGTGKMVPYQGGALGRMEGTGNKQSIYSVPHAASFGWNHQELLRAAVLGESLSTRKGMMALRAYEERLEDVVFLGDRANQITGLLTDPRIPRAKLVKDPRSTSTNTVADATAVLIDGTGSATAQEVCNCLVRFVQQVESDSSDTIKPKGYLVVPPQAERYLRSTVLDATNRIKIAEEVEKITGLMIKASVRLKDVAASASGLAAAQNFVAVVSPDPLDAEIQIPHPLQFFAVQQSGLEYLVPFYAEFAGVAFYQPKAFRLGYY